MADFSIKAHDTMPPVIASFSSGGSAVNLTTAQSVTFIMRLSGSSATPKVHAAAVVVDAGAGQVQYNWTVGDTDTPGSYQAEWQIIWIGGGKQTVPTTSYHTIDVLADLDGA